MRLTHLYWKNLNSDGINVVWPLYGARTIISPPMSIIHIATDSCQRSANTDNRHITSKIRWSMEAKDEQLYEMSREKHAIGIWECANCQYYNGRGRSSIKSTFPSKIIRCDHWEHCKSTANPANGPDSTPEFGIPTCANRNRVSDRMQVQSECIKNELSW